MSNKVKRIGVLTSGGDAPGMNAAIRAIVRTCRYNNIDCLGIRRGYSGLINGDVTEFDETSVSGIVRQGGTVLYTARCPEFMHEEGQKKAADTCRYLGIDALVTIGGDGTFRGALDLSKFGVHMVGIPATIDNDIACTEYTIGFDTAANTAIEMIDKLSDTMQSHERVSIVEVMGRRAGHLAMAVGLASGATAILVPERPFDFDNDIFERLRVGRIHGRMHHIVIVAEGVGDCDGLARRILETSGMEARITILGHVQRGGTPSSHDRIMATKMGVHAVTVLLEGRENRVVCWQDDVLLDLDIVEALKMKKDLDPLTYEYSKIVTT